MSLQEEIQSIVSDTAMTFEEKGKKLAKLVTKAELNALLAKEKATKGTLALKEPLKPKTSGMRILRLSIYDVYFKAIEKGTKKQEYRDYKEYYIKKCTYVENGKRYLVPFDAITFYVGRTKSMTVALTNITCDGQYFVFHLGKILRPNQKK